MLHNIQKLPIPYKLVGNGSEQYVREAGSIRFNDKLVLHNVGLLPNLGINLLSAGVLLKSKITDVTVRAGTERHLKHPDHDGPLAIFKLDRIRNIWIYVPKHTIIPESDTVVYDPPSRSSTESHRTRIPLTSEAKESRERSRRLAQHNNEEFDKHHNGANGTNGAADSNGATPRPSSSSATTVSTN